MISDPFINNSQSNIENLALNRASLDIPYTYSILKKSWSSSNIAKNNISPNSLSNRVKIRCWKEFWRIKQLFKQDTKYIFRRKE